MKIVFTDSFFESLEKLNNREKWYWKVWDFFKYDFLRGFKNIFFFWKVIWNFRSWQYSYQIAILKRSFEPLQKSMIESNEVAVSRNKKAEKIARLIQLLEHLSEDNYLELAEKKLGYEVNSDHLFSEESEPEEVTTRNRVIFDESNKIEEEEWEEILQILKGQDRDDFKALVKEFESKGEKAPDDLWDTWFDGSGLKGWWT